MLTDEHKTTLRQWMAEGYNDHLTAAITAALACDDALRQTRDALRRMVEHYVRLVESGDAGNWDAEKEPPVIAARAALGDQT